MSVNPIARTEAHSSPRGRVAAIALSTALITVAVAGGAFLILRDNESAASNPDTVTKAPAWFPAGVNDMLPEILVSAKDPVASSLRQFVVVSSVDEIARVSSFPGMDVPGMATEYVVVNDEASQAKFDELLRSLAEPGARPASIIDLR